MTRRKKKGGEQSAPFLNGSLNFTRYNCLVDQMLVSSGADVGEKARNAPEKGGEQ